VILVVEKVGFEGVPEVVVVFSAFEGEILAFFCSTKALILRARRLTSGRGGFA